jgi:hypothetical protein
VHVSGKADDCIVIGESSTVSEWMFFFSELCATKKTRIPFVPLRLMTCAARHAIADFEDGKRGLSQSPAAANWLTAEH